ncbi:glycoside hydrolase [Streptomyces sp. NBC_00433]
MDKGLPSRSRISLLTWAVVTAATVWAVLAGAAPVRAAPAAAAPTVSRPFAAHTDGIACYRLPSVISVPDPAHPHAVLAFAEGRVDSCADAGETDLVMKRSDDAGAHWGSLVTLLGKDPGEAPDAFQNIVPMVHVPIGGGPARITVMYAYNTVGTDMNGNPVRTGKRTLHILASTDYGDSWQAGDPVDSVLDDPSWTWVSAGPGHAVELRHGPHAGRMVVVGDYGPAGAVTPVDPAQPTVPVPPIVQTGLVLFYSDDGGVQWTRGPLWEPPAGGFGANEPALAERADGSIYVNARDDQYCTTDTHRVAGVTDADGTHFVNDDAAFAPVAHLTGPPVSGSLLTLSDPDGTGKGLLLYSGPSRAGPSSTDRQAMSIRASTDQGATWTDVGTLIDAGHTGYSDMTRLAGDASSPQQIGLVYETAATTANGTINFTSFTTQWLDANTTALVQRTSDGTGLGSNGVVNGGAALITRGSGTAHALSLDGIDDYVRVVNCPDHLRLTQGEDFTVAAWINYTATTGTRPIVWGYGQDAAPQFWLRAELDGGNHDITGRSPPPPATTSPCAPRPRTTTAPGTTWSSAARATSCCCPSIPNPRSPRPPPATASSSTALTRISATPSPSTSAHVPTTSSSSRAP